MKKVIHVRLRDPTRALKSLLPPVFKVDDAIPILATQYKAPLKALHALERQGALWRLKRGTYAFAEGFDPLAAASVLYGPSYVSFETALSYYGMIPERVEAIISVVDGRPAQFSTTHGEFVYHSQSRPLFARGMGLEIKAGQQPVLIAIREKALLDTLALAKLPALQSTPEAILEYVIDGLRIDQDVLLKLSRKNLHLLAPLYRNHAPRKLDEAILSLTKKGATR